ncbi:hypothetical protein M409DRAFT_21513 [Zasmidium cellare ATCC 36951]|uniref:Mitochondrial import inner membrane translocase subunit TIM50 n=1 Tax=Zasmidium cellare ATCC 36951 TaxID=1080233 RepID=A0A6A6CRF4_ZASCE|nr:uncharacterized protein M409DRAFT_21513 [Zasmidium cellare ATCC 36951]KAF2168066.1 hypothetical protein M409DRAFT_21513 [Zasmidium cellare ATCC 36951]
MSDSGQAANKHKMVDGLRDLSNTAPLTTLQPSSDKHTLATLPQHLPPSPPTTTYSNELEGQQIFGGSAGQVDVGARGATEFYDGGEQHGYQQHCYNQYSWSRPACGSWLPSTTPPPETTAGQFYAGNLYGLQPQYAAPQQSWWNHEYQQPLTQSYYSAAPSQQYQQATNYPLNANSLSFTPAFQQNSEYSQTSSVPTPTAPSHEKKKREKKSRRQKRLEKLSAAGGPDLLSNLDLWARAPLPERSEVGAPVEKQEAAQLSSTASTPAPQAKKKFNPRETKRLYIMQRPTPTSTYLHYATQPPQTMDFSRPLLVILDLNGTLLYRKTFGGSNAFTPRPHVYDFLDYLFNNHTVMVWSSSKPENVARMCSDLFTSEQRSKLAAVWARDKLRIPANAYNQKVQVYKQLSWVWNDAEIQASNPVSGGVWTQANTVLIDDSIEKSVSEPHNLIELEEFEAKPTQMETNVLDSVARYLDDLRSQRDVSAYMRLCPFVYDPSQPGKVIGQEKKNSRKDDIDELIKRVTGGA